MKDMLLSLVYSILSLTHSSYAGHCKSYPSSCTFDSLIQILDSTVQGLGAEVTVRSGLIFPQSPKMFKSLLKFFIY